MKVVLQRVKNATVTVEGQEVGSVKEGLLLLVGIHEKDTEEHLEWMCSKILKLRVFDDKNGKMNNSIIDIDGQLLVVSQFTLYGDVRKGNRPGYIEAAGPRKAEKLYDRMIDYFKHNSNLKVAAGRFGAHMDVQLINDGPVTIILDK